MNDATTQNDSTAKIIYILYLVGLVFGITGIIGVVMAYIHKNDADEWLKSHYQFQIRTFWIGLLIFVLGFLLTVILIGFVILLFGFIWMIIRCIKGMKALEQKQAHPNPTSWMFS